MKVYLYHVYIIVIGSLLSYLSTPLVALCSSLLYILFCWFQATAIMCTVQMDFSTGSYCPLCKTITGMGLKHCTACNKCVPQKWKHSVSMGRCSDKSLIKRWIFLFRLIVLLYSVLTVVCLMVYLPILFILPLHIYVLKSTYRKNNMGINKGDSNYK